MADVLLRTTTMPQPRELEKGICCNTIMHDVHNPGTPVERGEMWFE